MRDQIIKVIKDIDLGNCSGLYIYQMGDELVVDECGFGTCLECVETCNIDDAVDYLIDCF